MTAINLTFVQKIEKLPYGPLRSGGHLRVSSLAELSGHILNSLHHLLLQPVLLPDVTFLQCVDLLLVLLHLVLAVALQLVKLVAQLLLLLAELLQRVKLLGQDHDLALQLLLGLGVLTPQVCQLTLVVRPLRQMGNLPIEY